jgi:subtilisin
MKWEYVARGWTVPAALALMASVLVAIAPTSTASAAPVERTSVIVVLDRDVDAKAAAPALAARAGGSAGLVFDEVVGGFEFEGPLPAVAALAAAPGVKVVVPNEEFSLVDLAPWGLWRIDAPQAINSASGPYRGSGTRLATIDSGIDTDHPDLGANIEPGAGIDCQQNPIEKAPPEDDNGHGTHIAGTAAAAFNSEGVVGVAPDARIAAFKAFDAAGNASTANLLCAFNELAKLVAEVPMPTVVNMSFADVGTDSACNDGDASDVLHEAICDLVEVGEAAGVPVIPVAAAGNAGADASGTIPAAFSDVITVSALADFDGQSGGLEQCPYIPLLFNWECDDTLASFSNWGAVVDVIAPGVEIYSTIPGGYDYNSGTSMAAPHVSGVVAQVLSEHASLDVQGVKDLLARTGECPDGSTAGADGSCDDQGQWQRTINRSLFDPVEKGPDPDGIPEPLVNSGRAAATADAEGDPAQPPPPPPPPADDPPSISIGTPTAGATVEGTVTIAGTAGDDQGVATIEVFVDGISIGTTLPGADGFWTIQWDTGTYSDGTHSIVARATDAVGQETDTGALDVIVANSATSTIMHVAGLLGSGSNGKKWTATATIEIADQSGNPVDGATVTLSVAAGVADLAAKGGNPGRPGGGGGGGGGGSDSGTLSCTTDATGRCSTSLKPSGTSVLLTVTDVVKPGWTYDAAANVATSIQIAKG